MRSLLKVKWIAIALIVLILAGMWGYTHYKENNDTAESVRVENKEARPKSKVLNVNSYIVQNESLTDKILSTGVLVPDEEVSLSFETSGKITNIYFKEGSMVEKGALLAKINDAKLKAQLAKLQSQLPLAENRVFRQKTLLQKDAVSQEAYEQVVSELAQLKSEIELVKAEIAQTELYAPFTGYIGLRNVSEGAFVNTNTVISQLTKTSPMKIDFFVPEKYASNIKPNSKIFFRTELNGTLNEAKVLALDAVIDDNTHTRKVRASFENRKGSWVPGTFVSIEILLSEVKDAIAVPSQALVPEMGIDKVFVYRSGNAKKVEVKTGMRTESKIQILEGLSVGDTLITSGTLQLRDGMKVILN